MPVNIYIALYFTLGTLSTVAFFSRFIVQWVYSEYKKTSAIPILFWKFSLFGNCCLFLHYFIQVQFPFALTQAINGVFSWRNMNLMTHSPKPLKTLIIIFLFILSCIPLLFVFQSLFFFNHLEWMRTPCTRVPISFSLQCVGFVGSLLFSFRFWVQWWQSERKKMSILSPIFWWISIFGALLTTIYGIFSHDIVIIIGHCFGIVPYIRNLILLSKNEH